MGRGTWYYSLGVSSIIDAFVRVDGRSYLLSGATNSSEANGIIRNPKLELESFCFTFDLVPFSCGKRLYCLVGRKEERLRNGHVEVYGYAFWVNQCTSDFHGVNEPDDRGVTEGREDVREVFQPRRSGAKKKLSKCRRNQIGNEPILALPEGADDFVVYYECVKHGLEACIEKKRKKAMLTVAYMQGSYEGLKKREARMSSGLSLKIQAKIEKGYWWDLAIEEAYTTKYSIHPGADTMLVVLRFDLDFGREALGPSGKIGILYCSLRKESLGRIVLVEVCSCCDELRLGRVVVLLIAPFCGGKKNVISLLDSVCESLLSIRLHKTLCFVKEPLSLVDRLWSRVKAYGLYTPDFPDQEISIGGALSAKGRTELCTLLKGNLDIFAWQPSDMTGVPRSIAEHKLNIREGYPPIRQNKRGQAPERAKAIQSRYNTSEAGRNQAAKSYIIMTGCLTQ
ncbi:hypothetical protein Tco_1255688 [Tanacetum coccineum]